MMNPHWVRWGKASFSKHFADVFAAATQTLFCEGDDRDTAKTKLFAEFRIDGPKIRLLSRRYYRLFVPVNILITFHMNDTNVYDIDRLSGTALSAFADHISMYKYGPDAVIDDGSLVACFALMSNSLDGIKVSQFGQIDPILRTQQASVEGHYEAFITTE